MILTVNRLPPTPTCYPLLSDGISCLWYICPQILSGRKLHKISKIISKSLGQESYHLKDKVKVNLNIYISVGGELTGGMFFVASPSR